MLSTGYGLGYRRGVNVIAGEARTRIACGDRHDSLTVIGIGEVI